MTPDEISYIQNNVAEIHVERAAVSDIAFIIKK